MNRIIRERRKQRQEEKVIRVLARSEKECGEVKVSDRLVW